MSITPNAKYRGNETTRRLRVIFLSHMSRESQVKIKLLGGR